jgi:hypothetical protein
MYGPPLVREDVARRPSSPLAVDDSTTARDRLIDDGQGANFAKGCDGDDDDEDDDDDDDDDDSSYATMPPRPCNPTADVRRGVSSCGRGGCAWGEGGGGGGWDFRSWGQQQSVRARAQTFADRNRQLERTNVKWPKAPLNAPAMRRDDDADAPELGVVADSKHESGQQTGRILQ